MTQGKKRLKMGGELESLSREKAVWSHNLPLNSPFIPPIFFTMAANLVYWVNSSCTSRWLVPDPLATRVVRPGCCLNNFAPWG